ncbi:hypothetical protein [Jeotgalibacillus haloalkalitolerans]|uniref:DnaD domain-containing protein n=1 Tax=Jeotgalibacillus haloalkalitolerans TaxID=3104292 RepID=A0ABU5KRC4_9BACL|nr:hypothetical protein [Jeotgalibacillus sp. HH7-29]MDZ5713729.1 hypothetical protein [Jeotgalibacillus sp. HH7-29]
MQPIHLWLSVYDKQTKKPKRQIQPILPIVMLTYRESLKHTPVTEGELAALIDQSQLHQQYIAQLKRWEREGYFTIEERRFGAMVSRLFHLDEKAAAANRDLKKLKDRIELHMVSDDDLHYLSFSSLLQDKHKSFRTNHQWTEAADQLIAQKNL